MQRYISTRAARSEASLPTAQPGTDAPEAPCRSSGEDGSRLDAKEAKSRQRRTQITSEQRSYALVWITSYRPRSPRESGNSRRTLESDRHFNINYGGLTSGRSRPTTATVQREVFLSSIRSVIAFWRLAASGSISDPPMRRCPRDDDGASLVSCRLPNAESSICRGASPSDIYERDPAWNGNIELWDNDAHASRRWRR